MRQGGGDLDGRGVATVLSPEWIATIATGLLALIPAIWILVLQGRFWREWVWEQVGEGISATALAMGGRVRPLWTGWRVQGPSSRVDWRAGARGPRTRVVVRKPRRRRASCPSLASGESVLEMVGRLGGIPPAPPVPPS